VVPDLTRIQQEEDKILRDEVKRRRLVGEVKVRIVKGEVIGERRGGNEDVLDEAVAQNVAGGSVTLGGGQ